MISCIGIGMKCRILWARNVLSVDDTWELERRDVFFFLLVAMCVRVSSHRLTSVARVVAYIIIGVFGVGTLCMRIYRNQLIVVLAHHAPCTVLGTCWPLGDFVELFL